MLKSILKRLKKNAAPRWLVLLIDIYIVANTFILAYLIRFNFHLNFDISKLKFQLPFIILIALVGFLVVGSYKGIVRHTGVKDSINIVLANSIILVFLGGVIQLNHSFQINLNFTIPLSILLIHFLLNTVILIACRFLFKELYKAIIIDRDVKKRVLIYGTGQAGLITFTVLQEDNRNKTQVIGFVDDNKTKKGKTIDGLMVYNIKRIDEKFIKQKGINEIIISIQKVKPLRLIEIAEILSKLSVEVKIIPPVKDWIDNNISVHQIRPVNIEDLLGRAEIDLNKQNLREEFNSKVILITGAAGSIGSEISRQITNFKHTHLILIDQSESELFSLQQYFCNKGVEHVTSIVADVRNFKRMDSIFKQFLPDFVFHAAAYKHVPFMEENSYEAVRVNVLGTKTIADLSLKYKAEKFVMISTDKAVNPTNVMGATKRIAEMYINCLNKQRTTKFITTRFGNVLGSNGSVIPIFKRQIDNGGPLTVTHRDITRYFMTIPEACQLVLEAGEMGNGGEIFVFDMGESVKIYDLALNMIHLSGLRYPIDIDIEITGLRPGEKIYEELLGDGENTKNTYHDKIMIADAKLIDMEAITNKIIELCNLNEDLKEKETILKMKEIVPEFISNNSKYEILDKVLSTKVAFK